MSSETITLELSKRDVIGKGLKQLRDTGHVPAVIHNHGKDSLHVSAPYSDISKVFASAGKHHPVQLKVDGKQHLALIKDTDFEPVKHRLRHVVFQAIKQNEKTTAEIPVVLSGEDIPAQKKSLLVLTQLDHVEVEALPKDLPDQLTVDATTLEEVGDHLTVADIKVPDGVKILTDPSNQIAIVEMPKDQLAEADAAAASLAEDADKPAEPETTESSAEEPTTEGESPADKSQDQAKDKE